MLFGAHARGRQRKRVERELKGSPTWQVVSQGRWICPFCAALAVKTQGDQADPDAVLDHLEECGGFAGGEGAERPLAELRRAAAQRELRRMVKQHLISDPSWQLIDFSQRWFCPYCGDPTNVAVPKDRKMTEETLQGIAGHVQSCYAYDHGQGKEKPFAHLKAVVKYHNQSRKLAENVRRKLEGDPAWRRKDPKSRWICPYCLKPQEHIDLSSNLLMFENAPSLIAKHLAAACDEFRRGAQPQPLDTRERSDTGWLRNEKADIPDTDPHGLFRPSSGRQGPAPRPKTEPTPPPRAEPTPTPRAEPTPPPRVEPTPPPRAEPTPTPAPSDRQPRLPESPLETPSGRFPTTPWGKDGLAAQLRGHGTTLRQLEESGEFLLVDEPAERPAGPPSDAADGRAASSKSIARWREEIEAELKQVRSLSPLSRSGEHTPLDAPDAAGDPDQELARRLGLAARGLELRRVEQRGRTPRGDFVEVLELGSDRIALVAGGVAGDEGEAALISALVRNLIRRHAAANRCPSKVLQQVNADVFGDLDGRSLVAVTYALVDLASHRARLARAGLTAPVLLSPSRTPALTPLDCEGMVMGIDRGPIFDGSLEVRSLELAPGDLLVLFTKGLVEGRGAHREEFGIYRMHRLVERYGTHELAYFCDKFQEYFGMHVQPARDEADGCLVALRRQGPEG